MYNSPRNCFKLLAALFWVFTLSACQPDDDIGPKPSEFTKAQREELGTLVNNAIATNDRDFSILPNTPPYDIAYEHVQRLYGQAFDAIQKDIHSPSTDRWNSETPWEVHILVDNQKNAFILPGGDLYITTGMLKVLTAENQLYFIMAFELILMNEKFLFNRLLNTFNTTILVDMISGSPSPNGATPNSIAMTLKDLDFLEEDLLQVDEQAIQLICETSIWNPTGLISIYASSIDEYIPWIENRDYPGRVSRIEQLFLQEENSCGVVLESGSYHEKVISNIP